MRWHPQAELKKNENAVRARAFQSRCLIHRTNPSRRETGTEMTAGGEFLLTLSGAIISLAGLGQSWATKKQ